MDPTEASPRYQPGDRVRVIGGTWTSCIGKLATIHSCGARGVTVRVDDDLGLLSTAIENVEPCPSDKVYGPNQMVSDGNILDITLKSIERHPNEARKRAPKWTVLYNTVSDGWIARCWEFFNDERKAQTRYDQLALEDRCPTKRPFYAATDRRHMGAGHDMDSTVIPRMSEARSSTSYLAGYKAAIGDACDCVADFLDHDNDSENLLIALHALIDPCTQEARPEREAHLTDLLTQMVGIISKHIAPDACSDDELATLADVHKAIEWPCVETASP